MTGQVLLEAIRPFQMYLAGYAVFHRLCYKLQSIRNLKDLEFFASL